MTNESQLPDVPMLLIDIQGIVQDAMRSDKPHALETALGQIAARVERIVPMLPIVPTAYPTDILKQAVLNCIGAELYVAASFINDSVNERERRLKLIESFGPPIITK